MQEGWWCLIQDSDRPGEWPADDGTYSLISRQLINVHCLDRGLGEL